MMSWFSECILQLCQPEQWCLLHMSGRGLVVIWASLQLVRPRAGAELFPAAPELHFYHWVPFFLIRCFSTCLSCFAVCLWSFSLSCLILPPLLSVVISCTPPSPFISWSLFLALSAGFFLPPSNRSRCSSGGNSPSRAASEFRASFIEFAQDSGRACLPIRSWWGASRLWANPQIHLTPACVSKCVYLDLEIGQSVRVCWGFILNIKIVFA